MRMIVVEDEQRSREGLCRLLSTLPGDHQLVGQASNGAAALDLILQLKPDVVFTDVKMPIMDGISLIASVRSYNVQTEFVITSGYADFEFARQGMALEVADYLIKPVTQEDALRVLEHVERRLSGKKTKMKGSRLRSRYPDAHPTILKSLDILESSYAGKINQRDLAAELGVSPEYFSYLFSRNIGMTFSEFLRRLRVEKARELYASGECPKQEVPYAVGFSDAKYFAQVFKAVTGESPAEYLKSHNL